MGDRNGLVRVVERKCAIRSLLDEFDVDAYVHSCDPEVQKLRDVVFPWVRRRRTLLPSILTKGVLASGPDIHATSPVGVQRTRGVKQIKSSRSELSGTNDENESQRKGDIRWTVDRYSEDGRL